MLLASATGSGASLPLSGLGSSLPAVVGMSSVFPQQIRSSSDMLSTSLFAQPNDATLKQLMNLSFPTDVPQMNPLGLPTLGVSPEMLASLSNSNAASQFFQIQGTLYKMCILRNINETKAKEEGKKRIKLVDSKEPYLTGILDSSGYLGFT
ncbi:hypothetical protein ACTXT7_003655 [Hymenolepis weldensis]